MDKILKQKAMYYGLWQLVQKDTGEYAVGYWNNMPPSSRRFYGRSFETLKEAEDYWKIQGRDLV